jgi:hypothetical protein
MEPPYGAPATLERRAHKQLSMQPEFNLAAIHVINRVLLCKNFATKNNRDDVDTDVEDTNLQHRQVRSSQSY